MRVPSTRWRACVYEPESGGCRLRSKLYRRINEGILVDRCYFPSTVACLSCASVEISTVRLLPRGRHIDHSSSPPFSASFGRPSLVASGLNVFFHNAGVSNHAVRTYFCPRAPRCFSIGITQFAAWCSTMSSYLCEARIAEAS